MLSKNNEPVEIKKNNINFAKLYVVTVQTPSSLCTYTDASARLSLREQKIHSRQQKSEAGNQTKVNINQFSY